MSQAAWGQSTSPYPECMRTATPAQQDAARAAYFAGLECYKKGDFRKATAYWEEAYRLDCNANLLLLNIGGAHQRLEQWDQAITALTEYLRREPNAPDRAEIEARIAELKAQTQSTSSTATEPAKPPGIQTDPSKPAENAAQEPPNASSSIAPWIVVGAGAAVSIAGTVLALYGSSRISKANEACNNSRDCTEYAEIHSVELAENMVQNGNKGRTQKYAGTVLVGIGLTGIAVGLVWNFAFNNSSANTTDAPSNFRWQPAFAPHYAGVSVSSRF